MSTTWHMIGHFGDGINSQIFQLLQSENHMYRELYASVLSTVTAWFFLGCCFGIINNNNLLMTENDAEEKFYTAYSLIRSVISIAVSIPNSSALDVVHNFIYRKPSSSLVKSNVFTVTSEGHLRLPWQHRPPEVTWRSQSTAAALATESDKFNCAS